MDRPFSILVISCVLGLASQLDYLHKMEAAIEQLRESLIELDNNLAYYHACFDNCFCPETKAWLTRIVSNHVDVNNGWNFFAILHDNVVWDFQLYSCLQGVRYFVEFNILEGLADDFIGFRGLTEVEV